MARGKRCGRRRRTSKKRRSTGTTHRRHRTGGLSTQLGRRSTGGLGILKNIPYVGGILSAAVDILN